jgi:hypothetical protein
MLLLQLQLCFSATQQLISMQHSGISTLQAMKGL